MNARMRQRGFSLLEVVVVLSILMIVAGILLPQIGGMMHNANDESNFQLALGQVRQARMQAIESRRIIHVTFSSTPATVVAVPIKADGADETDPLLTRKIIVPKPADFAVVPGIPTSANLVPDGFGAGTAAIDLISKTNQLYFYPDGSARTATGAPNGGVIYLSRGTDLLSCRAITILAGTGRIGAWRFYSNGTGGIWKND